MYLASGASAQISDAGPLLEPLTVDLPTPDAAPGVQPLGFVHLRDDGQIFHHTERQGDEKIQVQLNLAAASNFDEATSEDVGIHLDNETLTMTLSEQEIGPNLFSWSGSVQGADQSNAAVGVMNDAVSISVTLGSQVIVVEKVTDENLLAVDRPIYHIEVQEIDEGTDGVIMDLGDAETGIGNLNGTDPDRFIVQSGEPEGEDNNPTVAESDQLESQRCAAELGIRQITVAVFYTPELREQVGRDQVQADILKRFGQFAELMRNSQIGSDFPIGAQFRLAGPPEELQILETNNTRAMLTSFAKLPAAQSRRQQLEADIISLILSRRVGDNCGWGYIPGQLFTSWRNAANVVPRWCLNNNLSLLHEIGHNWGAGHYDRSCPGEGIFPYSCGWGAGSFSTIMKYATRSQPRVLYHSNPGVSVNGVATGRPTHNNAKTLLETRCRVSEWQ